MKNDILELEELETIKSKGGVKENSAPNRYLLRNKEFLKLKSSIERLEKSSMRISIKKIKS